LTARIRALPNGGSRKTAYSRSRIASHPAAEVFAQVVDRERRPDQLRQAEHHQLQPAEILHALEAGDLLAHEEVPVLA